MWVFLWVFISSAVKPGVPKHGIEVSNPQISPQDPAQGFLKSISGTVGMWSILGLSPVFQHPVVEVNQQHIGCTPEVVPLFIGLCDLLVWLLKARSAAKLIFLMHSCPRADEMTFNNTKRSGRGPVSAPDRYRNAWEVLGCREQLSALQTMIERVEIRFVCFSLTPGLQSRKMRTSCTHVN